MERSRGRVVDHGKRERALNMADNDTKAPGATPAGKTTRTKAKTAAKTVKKEAAKAKDNAAKTLKDNAGKLSEQASGKARDYAAQGKAKASGAIEEFSKLMTRSEENTSELQSLMRISYAVSCMKKQTNNKSH